MSRSLGLYLYFIVSSSAHNFVEAGIFGNLMSCLQSQWCSDVSRVNTDRRGQREKTVTRTTERTSKRRSNQHSVYFSKLYL